MLQIALSSVSWLGFLCELRTWLILLLFIAGLPAEPAAALALFGYHGAVTPVWEDTGYSQFLAHLLWSAFVAFWYQISDLTLEEKRWKKWSVLLASSAAADPEKLFVHYCFCYGNQGIRSKWSLKGNDRQISSFSMWKRNLRLASLFTSFSWLWSQ